MVGWLRVLPTLLIAIVLLQFVGLAWAELATDRPFSCHGPTQQTIDISTVCIFADAHTAG
jgi:hypothetical protein